MRDIRGGFVGLAAVVAGATLTVPAQAAPEADPRPAEPLVQLRAFASAEVGVSRPVGLAWSPQRGTLLVTASPTRLVRVAPDGTRVGAVRSAGPTDVGGLTTDPRTGAKVGVESGRLVRREADGSVTRVPVEGAQGHDLRGLAGDPRTGLLYSFDATTEELLGVSSADGQVMETFDASSLGLSDVRGVAVAPSADGTDDPAVRSVFLADAGGGGESGQIVETTLEPPTVGAMTAYDGEVVDTIATSAFDPPSPDPSGLAYLPDGEQLLISDGEVNEMPIFRGVNLFATSLTGDVESTGVSQPWSDEPVGAGYNADNNHLFISDDDQKEVFEIEAGSDGIFGTSDDSVNNFDTNSFGNSDPEGLDYDPASDSLWIVDGVNKEVFRVRPGADGRFGTSDDVTSQFDVLRYGARDPEGLGYDPVRDTIVIVDDGSDTIYELSKSGALLNTISTTSAGMTAAAGLAVGPHSSDPSKRSYYVVARGLDNDSNPTENDGRLYEITADLLSDGGGGGERNEPPSVDAGSDAGITLPATASLNGDVTDDGLPDPPGAVTTRWSQQSGPGDVSFDDRDAEDTTASFSEAGNYVLRLTADDGGLTASDEVRVEVEPADESDGERNITLRQSTTALVVPGEVRLSGRVTRAGDNAPVPNATVRIMVTRAPGITARRLRVLTTGTNGSFSFTDSPRVISRYVAVHEDQRSVVRRVIVRPRLTAALSDTSVRVGERVRVRGVLSPSAARTPVRLQRWNGEAWRVVQRQTRPARAKVGYRFAVRHLRAGTWRYRVVVPAYAGRARTVAPRVQQGLVLRVSRR